MAGARRNLANSRHSRAALDDILALSFGEQPSSPSSSSGIGAIGAGGTGVTEQASDYHPFSLPSARRIGGESHTRRPPPQRSTIAPPNDSSESGEHEVFFDSGDAMLEHADNVLPAHSSQSFSTAVQAPATAPAPSTSGGTPAGDALPSYDFERQSYFSAHAMPPSASGSSSLMQTRSLSRASNQGVASASRAYYAAGAGSDAAAPASGSTVHLGSYGGNSNAPNSNNAVGLAGASSSAGSGMPETNVSRLRVLLGRFGRLVGMRVPGALYSTLSQNDREEVAQEGSGSSAHMRRIVVGSGLGSDGVFANLSAKPDRRRQRRDENGQGADRGEDDDLEDEVHPPNYEAAAADQAPPYWETTIIGGPGSLHPLAPGGLGWTPGSPVIGAIEDLILEGLPIGNLFGFAWNLLVSSSFQFVGFLLTYLLHTTHAAKCGSRAGLGITLVQYGYYLRSGAAHLQAVQAQDGGGGNHHADDLADDPASKDEQQQLRQQKDAIVSNEVLAYILIALGFFILVNSLLSYWRVYRWGYQLVGAARREQAAAAAAADADADATHDTATAAADADTPQSPYTLATRVRAFFAGGIPGSSSSGAGSTRAHDAEDWIIFPGAGRRLTDVEEGRAGREPRRAADDDDDQEDNEHDSRQAMHPRQHSSPEEARLVNDLRATGFLS
ncbi:hypothetical protein K437DRAFT_253937 [Tilletiaria anomala UBC 951]|uniref:Uncharacterized protein n=1 Tax=Tilletiaria anomala (strain ATCC 24038 / CBS 436.72 / UBC 951) TaxID=1037660 RepID=A0A066WFI6_TILAU|nr:uncharacterized protein K437DRAFT_253937 [Tilletiaria anomala UBC 951]KDN52737.1 hypothetical protein K437DRAFT_253937 [Tilletiaria anomala UBC 951]